MFVLPSKSKFVEGLIDKDTFDKENVAEKKKVRLQWAFCKYLWESHVLFEEDSN